MALKLITKNTFHKNNLYKNITIPLIYPEFYEIQEVTDKINQLHNATFPQKYNFLGFIKRIKHFITFDNKIFIQNETNFKYINTNQFWCHHNKIIYTYGNPQQYRLLKYKNKNYFYDVRKKDTYTFNENKNIVIYSGIYNPKLELISYT